MSTLDDLLKIIEARVFKACAEFDETLPDDDALIITVVLATFGVCPDFADKPQFLAEKSM